MEERIPQPEDPQLELEAPAIAAAPAALVGSSGDDSSDEGEFEFEFPSVSRDSPAGTAAPADELFADGRIRPFYPVFGRGGVGFGGVGCVHGRAARPAPAAAAAEPRVRGRLGRLFLEENLQARDSSASSTASTSSSAATDDDGDGLDGAAPESYCVWRPGGGASPAPRPPRKSGSTGSMARWRRISDLIVGRSHSDGKEKFVFFAAPMTSPHDANSKNSDRPRRPRPAPPAAAGGRKPPPHSAAAEVDTAHRMAYLASGTPRRTFLPYREELVGFFANVNGVSRSHQHPF